MPHSPPGPKKDSIAVLLEQWKKQRPDLDPSISDCQRGADARAQVLGVGGDRLQHLGGHVERQPVHRGLVLVGDIRHRCRHREHDVVILDRQQIGLARMEPALRCSGTSGSAGCGRSCTRSARCRSRRSAGHARPAPRCGTG
jgi:hypothetical protein